MAKKAPSKSTDGESAAAPESNEAVFAALVAEKRAAGLTKAQAEFCAQQQLDHDAAQAGE
jgi:hypothetical protein